MIVISKKIPSTKKICIKRERSINIKLKSFHSTAAPLMWTRFTTPVKRYGAVLGLGWSAKKAYDNTQFSGKVEASWNEGAAIIQGKGKIISKDYTVTGNYGASDGFKGSIEKTSFISNNNDIRPIFDSPANLSPFTEKLIQFSLILGLAIEISLIAFCCFAIYSYGISGAYTIFKNKLNSVKDRSVIVSSGSIVLFLIIMWLASLQYAFDIVAENSCKNSMEIVKLKSIIDGIYTV